MASTSRRAVLFLLALLPAVFSEASRAQTDVDPVALAKAKELISVSNLVAMRDDMAAFIGTQISALVKQANPDQDDKVDRAVKDLVLPVLKRHLPEYLDLAAAVYAKHFTRDELTQIVAFYKSPVGQKFSREQANVVPDITEMTKGWINRIGNAVLKETGPDLQKRGLKVPGA